MTISSNKMQLFYLKYILFHDFLVNFLKNIFRVYLFRIKGRKNGSITILFLKKTYEFVRTIFGYRALISTTFRKQNTTLKHLCAIRKTCYTKNPMV